MTAAERKTLKEVVKLMKKARTDFYNIAMTEEDLLKFLVSTERVLMLLAQGAK